MYMGDLGPIGDHSRPSYYRFLKFSINAIQNVRKFVRTLYF